MSERTYHANLTSLYFQRLVTNSTAVSINSTSQSKGIALLMSVETQSIRATFDGSTPTANTGILLTAANSPYYYEGIDGSKLKIARATAGAIVNLQTFTL